MRKVLSVFLAVVLLLGAFPATVFADANETIFTIESGSARQGQTVTVGVSITGNPGITSANLEFTFSDDLTLVGAEQPSNGAFAALGKVTKPSKLESTGSASSPCSFAWFTNEIAESDIKDGTILKLTFLVSEEATLGENLSVTISSTSENIIDNDAHYVPFTLVAGSIKVIDFMPGDVNGDESINMLDVLLVCRYIVDGCKTDSNGYNVTLDDAAADVDASNSINMRDVLLLCRYIVDGCKYDPDGYAVKLLASSIGKICEHENLTAVDAKAATCVSTGNIAYWVCDDCGKYFSDSTGTTEITLESTVTAIDQNNHEHTEVVSAKAPTKTETGSTEGIRCTDCGAWIVEPESIPIPLEHSITYNIAGNDTYLQSMAISNPNPTEYVTGETCNLVDLHVDGYTFDGWYTESGDKITQIPSTANEDYVLTAKWSKIAYTVQFNVSMIDPEQRELLVINKNAEGTAKNEYTSDKAWVLPALTMDTYTFVGWSDQNGNFYTDNVIPRGTTGDLILKDNWVSQRNRAVAKTTLDEPLVVEDLDNQIIYFTYEIGTIENVPLYTTQELNCVNGIVTIVEKTVTHSITEEDMQKLGTSFTTETTDSTQFELSQEITDATITTENYGKSETEINELTETQAKSQSSTQSFNTSSGGSSQTYQYNDKTTKDETNQSYVLNTNLDSGMSTELTTELKNTTEVSAGVSFPIDIIKVDAGVKNTTEVSVGTDTKAYVDSSIGTESTWDNYTYEEDYQANSTTNNAYWNTDSGYTTAQQSSSSATVSEAIHETISSTYEYGKTYSEAYGNKSQRGSTSATGNTTDNVASFTYTTADIESTTVGLQTTGKTYGNYRMIMAGTMHVFAVVGYDVAKQDYFVYTYNVMGDGTKNDGYKEIMDYSYDRSFADWESTVIPFTVPEYVINYIGSRTTYTEGLEYDFDNANHTATVEAYTGNDPFVYIPSYMVDSEGTAFRVTGFTSNAFQGKNIIAISLGKFITEIPNSAFKGCSSLEYIVCPRVTSIGNEAFSGCTSLKAFEIPEETTSVGTEAFKDVPEIKATVHQYEENETVVMDSATIAENIASSGAKSITLDISNVPTEDTVNLAVSNCDSFVIDGGNKAFTELSIDSSATSTKLSRISVKSSSGSPVKLNSDSVTMYMMSIENSNGFGVLLLNETTNLTLSGTNSIVSTGGKALLCNNVNVNYENSGKLNVNGDIYTAGTITDVNNRIVFTSAEPAWEIKSISADEFNLYLLGEITVSYDVNGGNELETSSVKTFRQTAIGELPIPTREYYDFDGWFTEKEGGTLVTADSTFSEDTTIYAHWTRNIYTVSFDAAGGSVSESSRTCNCGSSVGSLPTPSKDYNNFKGWYTSSGVAVDSNYMPNADVTLYAHWEEKGISSWVLASQVPAGAKIVSTSYSYRLSYSANNPTGESGYTRDGSYQGACKASGTNHYASFPAGYNTDYYSQYNISPQSAYETDYEICNVSNEHCSWIYWHWMYDVAYSGTANRPISTTKGTYSTSSGNLYFKYFTAIESSDDCAQSSGNYVCGDYDYTFYDGKSLDRTYSPNAGTWRYFRVETFLNYYAIYYKMWNYHRDFTYQSTDPNTINLNGKTLSNRTVYCKYQPK